MARTTLDLDDAVLRELKRRRSREHKSIGVIASELLAQALAADAPDVPPFEWTSKPMAAKVDLEDKDAVWAALEDT